MAKTVLLNPQIVINSVDLSAWCDMVTIEETWKDIDTTAFGQVNMTRVAGLGDHKFVCEFQQDFAGGAVDATVSPLVGLTTNVTVKPVNAATTTTNPAYTFVVVVQQYKPLDGKVGDLSKSSVTWPISGAVTRATS